MKGIQNHLSHTYISPTEVGMKVEAIFTVGLEITHIGDAYHAIKILEEETEVTLAIEEITDIICKVFRDIGTIIMIIGETIIEVKATIEIGVGHYIDRTEVEGETEAQVMVGLGQDEGQVQTEIGLDALSVESMITL